MFCHYCGMLGHDLKHCATHFALEKNGREVEYQYGNWLKATGDHPRYPPRRDLGKVLILLMIWVIFQNRRQTINRSYES